MKRSRILLILAVTLVLALLPALFSVPQFIDARINSVIAGKLIPVSKETQALHAKLLIVDLHDDLLLWNRDPLEEHARGHTDVPRLLRGHTAVQVFSAVTKTPRGLNYDSNTGDSDNITMLAILEHWPLKTWGSLTQRALYQARRLHDAARRSAGALTVITRASELNAFLKRPNAGKTELGGILAIEGLHALDGKLANLDTLYDAGYRIMGLTHFFDNEVAASAHGVTKGGLTAASAHGVTKGGLTPLGRELVRRMEERRITIDLAHLAPAAVDEVLQMARRPVVVSHTGVQATCPGPRNLSDDQIKRIAANGGLIGIGYWDAAVCAVSARSAARAMRHVATIAGVQHVALGSDFDGATQVPFDASQLVQMTQALRDGGFRDDEIRGIMGENAIRFLQANLPR